MEKLAKYAQAHGHETRIEGDVLMVRSVLWHAATQTRTFTWDAVSTFAELRNLLGY
jgi:hypothetical protein